MLRARGLHPDDEDTKGEMLSFIEKEKRGGLFDRPAALLKSATDSGKPIYIKDDDLPKGRRIVAVSLMFDFTGKQRHYVEIGTHLVALSHEKRGFQIAMARIQVAHACLDLKDHKSCPIFAVMENKSTSLRNAVDRARFKTWAPPKELRALRDAAGVRSVADRVVCAADSDAIDTVFSDLRECVTDGVLTTHTGARIHLDFPWLVPLLEAGPYWKDDDDE